MFILVVIAEAIIAVITRVIIAGIHAVFSVIRGFIIRYNRFYNRGYKPFL